LFNNNNNNIPNFVLPGDSSRTSLPCSSILAYQGLEENLDQKSPGHPGWGLMQQASPLLIEKRKLLKSPLETHTHTQLQNKSVNEM